MKPLEVLVILLGSSYEINCAGILVDDRCPKNSNQRIDILVPRLNLIVSREGYNLGRICEVYAPERQCVRTGIAIGVKRINAVIHGRDIDNVVNTVSRDGDVR